MATCGHCKAIGQTIAHVRSCGQSAVATLPTPDLQPGNVVTLRNADGYWLVIRQSSSQPGAHVIEKILAGDRRGEWAYVWAYEVEILFPDMNAAADYRIAQDQAAERERVSKLLHGDKPSTQREMYYASNYEARGELPSDAQYERDMQEREAREERQAYERKMNREDWAPVNELRRQIAPLLPRKIRGAMVGHYAIRVNGVVKFYRVKQVLGGRWDGKVFVEAQASDTLYPVKAPGTLTEVLTAILADPQAAATLYGTELEQCYRCNRALTDETSRALGIGPECRSK